MVARIILVLLSWTALATAAELPISGREDERFNSFDQMMISFMAEHGAPGGALAVSWGGKVVYARGFGWADEQRKQAVRSESLFRIASVSKPITGVAVMQLVEKGKIGLDDRVFPLLKVQPWVERGGKIDPRIQQVTVRQLLNHTGGWDRDASFDPMFRPVEIARALGVVPPAQIGHVVRYMLGRELDFEPGQKHAYSNFGYCVLGRLIEGVSGQTYEQYVKQEVLRPLGITQMKIGKTLEQAQGEVKYYARGKTGKAVVGPKLGQKVPLPYGAWYLETMDAHGGWIGSAVDLVKFAAAFDEPEKCALMKARTIEKMFERPQGPAGYEADGKPKAAYYACGWMVWPVGDQGKFNAWHNGKLAGTAALVVRRHDGINWAVVFNTDEDEQGRYLGAEIDGLVHRAADAVNWQELGR